MNDEEELKDYVLEIPTRGIQTVVIRAKSRGDAIRRFEHDSEGEGADYRVTWAGRPRVSLDRKEAR